MTDAPPTQQSSITLKLKSKEGDTFEVDKAVAMHINFVKGMLEDVDESDGMEIPMGEVDSAILSKVVEFCKFHHTQEVNNMAADEVDRWEKEFVQVDKSTLFQLILVCLSACFLSSFTFFHHIAVIVHANTFSHCCFLFCKRRRPISSTSSHYWT